MRPSQKQFENALQALMADTSKKIQNGMIMLKAHYHAKDKTISAKGLAYSIGYDNYNTANEQYGSLAHTISNLIDYKPEQTKNGQPIWTYTICSAAKSRDDNGHFQWVLKDEVCLAMEQMGMVSPTANPSVLDDLSMRERELNTMPEKDRDMMIKARVGQGIFREKLIEHWEGCAITGLTNNNFLVASHIKPWRDCSVLEATNKYNGLLLSPNLDKLFDTGYISFNNEGGILLSTQLTAEDTEALNVSNKMKLRKLSPQHRHFLDYHRTEIFKK